MELVDVKIQRHLLTVFDISEDHRVKIKRKDRPILRCYLRTEKAVEHGLWTVIPIVVGATWNGPRKSGKDSEGTGEK